MTLAFKMNSKGACFQRTPCIKQSHLEGSRGCPLNTGLTVADSEL